MLRRFGCLLLLCCCLLSAACAEAVYENVKRHILVFNNR